MTPGEPRNRWWIGYQKVRNDKGHVAHLHVPGFVVSEKHLRNWPAKDQQEYLLLGPLEAAEDICRRLKEGE